MLAVSQVNGSAASVDMAINLGSGAILTQNSKLEVFPTIQQPSWDAGAKPIGHGLLDPGGSPMEIWLATPQHGNNDHSGVNDPPVAVNDNYDGIPDFTAYNQCTWDTEQ